MTRPIDMWRQMGKIHSVPLLDKSHMQLTAGKRGKNQWLSSPQWSTLNTWAMLNKSSKSYLLLYTQVYVCSDIIKEGVINWGVMGSIRQLKKGERDAEMA